MGLVVDDDGGEPNTSVVRSQRRRGGGGASTVATKPVGSMSDEMSYDSGKGEEAKKPMCEEKPDV